MKRLIVSLIVIYSIGCSKSDTPPGIDQPQKTRDSITLALQGNWRLDSMQSKSVRKCTFGTCVIINPDGTVRDTVRETKKYNNVIWSILNTELKRITPVGTESKNIRISDGFIIYPQDEELISILTLLPSRMVLMQEGRTVVVNDRYDITYRYYFFTK
ncbi:hypothetical protein [Chitinophaga sp. sic0106]|uniref:hypothetical protein n=1 Tax=Chitinophaga sp. sic0106 TaxID=2854785 RepID=UPI001C47DE1F|nr:hypothetical protein [Chitinophaga sp. sic0106]MBV7534083.1 hypothetical protein [Chitinophaga sp. sic0106]